jgi:DNA polymerase III alpha subunit
MIRTGFSFKSAVGHLPDVIERLVEIGWTVAPIADTLSTFGFIEWRKQAEAKKLKPVYGVELAVTTNKGLKRPELDWWTFLAKDSLRPLHDLIALATSAPGRDAALTYDEAIHAPGLYKITGPLVKLEGVSPMFDEDTYIGLSPAMPRAVFRKAMAESYQFCAMNANRYPRPKDKEFYRVMLWRKASTATFPQHIMSDDEWRRYMGGLGIEPEWLDAAIVNRDNILASCTAKIKTATMLVPDKEMSLRDMCLLGATKLGVDLTNPVYQDRLDRELSMIEAKQFEDYFYIVSDIMRWARQRMICGPARGSSCGSLVCYLLEITAVDPIPFDLLFERFIDTTRSDLPDIDVDFSDQRRQMVFDYVERKYGEERVARLGTVSMFQPRSSLNAAGTALRIPKWMVEDVLDNIIIRSSGDARALQQLEDTLKDTDAGKKLLKEHPEIMVAAEMEGHPSNAGQHAAGIVMTQEPVLEVVAVNSLTKSAMCDKYDAEALNLLKIDALGLTQLSIFERCLELIGHPDDYDFFNRLPLNDPAAFDVLNRRHYAGVFQFMGGALKSLTRQICVESLNDIIAITALARPGPMATGGANIWVRRRNGTEQPTYAHPILEPYLKETLGIVTYQEQVMQIGREVGDLSWEQVAALRRAISKSLGEEFFNQYGDPWKVGAMSRGIPKQVADDFWKDLCSFGSWGFNKSHAVAYGLVSYWCCWLKAHYPVEFAAATLDAESDPIRQIAILRELEEEGIGYVSIDREKSNALWSPVTEGNRKYLVGPLTNIKGFGPATVQEILTMRDRGEPLRATVQKRLDEARTEIDTLWPVRDRIKQLHPDLTKLKILTTPTPIAEVASEEDSWPTHVIVGVAQRIVPRDENETVKIAQRNGVKMVGPTAYLNLFMRDDTDDLYCRISRFDYNAIGKPVVERGRPGAALYALKGKVPPNFRMLRVDLIRYLGDMEQNE